MQACLGLGSHKPLASQLFLHSAAMLAFKCVLIIVLTAPPAPLSTSHHASKLCREDGACE
eukprot:1136894-Pelagomonas_calceolata.AAC.8